MAVNINNNYRNQYKVVKGMKNSFDAYWSKSGVKNDDVRVVMESLFNLLDDDIRNTTQDNDYNQTILDRTEFKDLFKIIEDILENYLSIEESDLKYTTDVVRSRIKSQINEEITSCLKKVKFDDWIDEHLEQDIQKIVETLFSKVRDKKHKNENKKEVIKETTVIESKVEVDSIMDKFQKKLSEDKVSGVDKGQKLYTEIKKSKEYQNFVKKVKNIFGGRLTERKKSDTAIRIQNLPQVVQGSQNNIKKEESKRTSFSPFFNLKKLFSRNDKLKRQKRNKKNFGVIDNTITKYLKNGVNLFKIEIKTKIFNTFKKGLKKINSGLNKLGGIFMNVIRGIFGFFGKIFSPIGKFLGGAWNAIVHPLQTLKKAFSAQSWLMKIIGFAFANPANAFIFGFLAHMVVDFFKETIMPYLNRYLIVPLLSSINFVMGFLSGGKGLSGILTNIFDCARIIFDFVQKLFKDRRDTKDKFATILLNMSDYAGNPLELKWVTKLSEIGFRLIQGFIKISSPNFMGGMLGSLPLIYRFGAAYTLGGAEGMGSLLEDDDGVLRVKVGDANSQQKDTTEIYTKIRDMLGKDTDTTKEGRKAISDTIIWSEEALQGIDDEQAKIRELEQDLQSHLDDDRDFDDAELDEYFKSYLFKDENYRSLFNQIIKDNGFQRYELLSVHEKVAILGQLLKLRQQRLNEIVNVMDSGDMSKIQSLRNVWNEDSLRINTTKKFSANVIRNLSGNNFQVLTQKKVKQGYTLERIKHTDSIFSMMDDRITIRPDDNKSIFENETQEVNDESQRRIISEQGVDRNSEFAQYMVRNGAMSNAGYNGKIVFPDTAHNQQLIATYRQTKMMQQQSNNIDSRIFGMFRQSPGFNLIFDIPVENMSDDELRSMIESTIPDWVRFSTNEKIQAINNLIDKKTSNQSEEQKKLKELVRQLIYREHIIIINKTRNQERSDMKGET